jgi:hypothetical protein
VSLLKFLEDFQTPQQMENAPASSEFVALEAWVKSAQQAANSLDPLTHKLSEWRRNFRRFPIRLLAPTVIGLGIGLLIAFLIINIAETAESFTIGIPHYSFYTLFASVGAALGAGFGSWKAFSGLNLHPIGLLLSVALVVVPIWGLWTTGAFNQAFIRVERIKLTPDEVTDVTDEVKTTTPKSTPTLRKSTPASTFPLKATPVAVATDAKPLAIDFLIDGIEVGEGHIKLNISIKRHAGNTALSWHSDEDRKNEIYLKTGSQRHNLIDMGGIFSQDTTLQSGRSYKGWFTFEKPTKEFFTFYYPDVKPLEIDLEKLGVRAEVTLSEASISTPRPTTPRPTPTRTPRPTSTPEPTPQPAVPSVSCRKNPQGEFANLWQAKKEWFGCPFANETTPLYGKFSEMPFERGHLFWLGDIDVYGQIRQVIATFGGQNVGDTGNWLVHPENWNGEGICGVPPPPQGLYLPDRGLAKVWCEIDGINRLGYSIAPQEFVPERGIDAIQNFEHAVIFRDSNGYTNGSVYVLFRETNSYTVIAYK